MNNYQIMNYIWYPSLDTSPTRIQDEPGLLEQGVLITETRNSSSTEGSDRLATSTCETKDTYYKCKEKR